MPGGRPDPNPGPVRNTQVYASPWDAFMLVFPSQFSSLRFFRGFFSVGMLATYPSFGPSQANFVHIHRVTI